MKKAVFYTFYVGLGGVLVLAWPFLCYLTIFAFDAPFHSRADEFTRYAFLAGVLTYPVFYVLGLLWGIRVMKKGAPWFSPKGPSVALFLLPTCGLCFLAALAVAADTSPRPQKVDDPTYRESPVKPWGTGEKGVYRAGVLVQVEDPRTFTPINFNWARDSQAYYCVRVSGGDLKVSCDHASMVVLNLEYAKDKDRPYWRQYPVTGADMASFHAVGRYQAGDRFGVFSGARRRPANPGSMLNPSPDR